MKVGDSLVAGKTSGRIKAMFNDRGKPIRKAEPSMPAKILGLSAVPQAGDLLTGFADDRAARAYLDAHKPDQAEQAMAMIARARTVALTTTTSRSATTPSTPMTPAFTRSRSPSKGRACRPASLHGT